ncbi:MAG: hypothetical protein KatS3mg002_1067 [Candidatus Woesearchaeota archaeon]|jgi:hypothetical protein|nr:MAG: hypothetical protein KatS3mg002_1067 [Candidatus Woesearchaeota archaeon]
MNNTFKKDPLEVLDYMFDFAPNTHGVTEYRDYLESDEIITTYTVTSSSGITIVNDYITDDGKAVVVWVSGGELYKLYEINLFAKTNSSPEQREIKRKIILEIVSK